MWYEDGMAKKGFAAMDPEKVREIARKGGKAAHAAGTAHEFTSEKAREAGRLGGKAVHAKRRAEEDRQLNEQSLVPRGTGER
jgi:general stress protein YciG